VPSVLRLRCSLEAFVDAACFEGELRGGATAGVGDIGFGPHRISASQIFYETPLSVAFVNIKPVLPGHVLVISRRRCRRFTSLRAAEAADLWLTAQRVGAALERHLGGSSLTLAIQDGPDAGQSVAHVHVHVLPRRRADLPDNDELYKIIDRTGVVPTLGEARGGAAEGSGGGRGLALDPLEKSGGVGASVGGVSADGGDGESGAIGNVPAAAAAASVRPALRSAEDMAHEADDFRALFV
jgi:bis(5'-adenosyl)-triphosphatase